MSHNNERLERLRRALEGALQPGRQISIDDIRNILRDLVEEALEEAGK